MQNVTKPRPDPTAKPKPRPGPHPPADEPDCSPLPGDEPTQD